MENTISGSGAIHPYENIVIGNFLYGLGLSIGLGGPGFAPKACINLMQQTPMDKKLGDVLLEFPGMVRLLEFKRYTNASTKERDKLLALRVVLNQTPQLEKVSRAMHWYVESLPSNFDQQAPINFCKYLDLDLVHRPTDLAAFTSLVARQALSPSRDEPSPALVRSYLSCVGDMAAAGTATAGGMLVSVSQDGEIRYVAVADIRDLQLQHDYLLDRHNELTRTLELAREMKYGHQYAPERTRGQSMER